MEPPPTFKGRFSRLPVGSARDRGDCPDAPGRTTVRTAANPLPRGEYPPISDAQLRPPVVTVDCVASMGGAFNYGRRRFDLIDSGTRASASWRAPAVRQVPNLRNNAASL